MLKEVAIGGLAAIECVALATHTDGVYFSLVVAVISGLAGFELGFRVCKVKKEGK